MATPSKPSRDLSRAETPCKGRGFLRLSKTAQELAKRKPSGREGFSTKIQSTAGFPEPPERLDYPLLRAALNKWEIDNKSELLLSPTGYRGRSARGNGNE